MEMGVYQVIDHSYQGKSVHARPWNGQLVLSLLIVGEEFCLHVLSIMLGKTRQPSENYEWYECILMRSEQNWSKQFKKLQQGFLTREVHTSIIRRELLKMFIPGVLLSVIFIHLGLHETHPYEFWKIRPSGIGDNLDWEKKAFSTL